MAAQQETQFEQYRPLMFSIAYRMLGSASEAEDIVQETYLRYRSVPPETIGSHKAFLSTIVTRLCLNQMQTARAQRGLLDRSLRAVSLGELDGLPRLLREDVVMWTDGGGKARGAATRPLHGREAVARFVLASTRLPAESYYAEIRDVNGEPALILRTAEKVIATLFLEEDQGYIKTIRAIGNPDKLERVQ